MFIAWPNCRAGFATASGNASHAMDLLKIRHTFIIAINVSVETVYNFLVILIKVHLVFVV